MGLGIWGITTSATLAEPMSADEQIQHNQQRQRDLEKRMSPPVDVRSASVPDATEDFPKMKSRVLRYKASPFKEIRKISSLGSVRI